MSAWYSSNAASAAPHARSPDVSVQGEGPSPQRTHGVAAGAGELTAVFASFRAGPAWSPTVNTAAFRIVPASTFFFFR